MQARIYEGHWDTDVLTLNARDSLSLYSHRQVTQILIVLISYY